MGSKWGKKKGKGAAATISANRAASTVAHPKGAKRSNSNNQVHSAHSVGGLAGVGQDYTGSSRSNSQLVKR